MKNRKRFGGALIAVLVLTILAAGCATQDGQPSRTTKGTAIGAATGAVLGGLIGSTQGEAGAGAVIGGLAGGAVGAAIGYNLDQQAKELAAIPDTQVVQQPDRVIVRMDNSILYATNSSTLLPGSQDTLNQIADVMVKYPDTKILIKGYTDNTGTEAYNQQLSERRATVVKNYLISRGVDAYRITAIGFGESVPIASNDTAEGRAMNRRVEIEIRPPADG